MLSLCCFLICITAIACTNSTGQNNATQDNIKSLFHAVYWEVKPFVFRNTKGEIDGIFPTIFKQASMFCYNGTGQLISYNEFRMESRREFLTAYASPYNATPEMQPGRDAWFPVLVAGSKEAKEIDKLKNLLNFDIDYSDELAIIVQRDYISLPYKVLRGILNCGQIFFLSFLLTVFFGILIWLLERSNNAIFPLGLINGSATGVWWSLVSMTTVGYGDVVPKTFLGRVCAVIWVSIGVMIACVITATVTETVNGVSDLNIKGNKVAVLENSFESLSVEDFRGIAVEFASYEDVLAAVRKGDVYAAAMRSDVAAWNIDDIEDEKKGTPLRIVKKLSAHLNFNMIMNRQISNMIQLRDIIRCMDQFKTEVYVRSVKKFSRYCPTETLYIPSIGDMFKTLFVQVLLAGIGLMFLIGMFIDKRCRLKNLYKKRKEYCEEMENLRNGQSENLRFCCVKIYGKQGNVV